MPNIAALPQWELDFMVRALEDNGYVVRRPSEANLESVLTVNPESEEHPYQMAVRLDANVNGRAFVSLLYFPVDMLLDPKNPNFRENVLPNVMAKELARCITERMIPGIVGQVKEKIDPHLIAGKEGKLR